MDKCSPYILPDLIVYVCPLGCNGTCARIWINENIGHRIKCKCKCEHNKKQVALGLVGSPANATKEIQPAKEATP